MKGKIKLALVALALIAMQNEPPHPAPLVDTLTSCQIEFYELDNETLVRFADGAGQSDQCDDLLASIANKLDNSLVISIEQAQRDFGGQ